MPRGPLGRRAAKRQILRAPRGAPSRSDPGLRPLCRGVLRKWNAHPRVAKSAVIQCREAERTSPVSRTSNKNAVSIGFHIAHRVLRIPSPLFLLYAITVPSSVSTRDIPHMALVFCFRQQSSQACRLGCALTPAEGCSRRAAYTPVYVTCRV